MPRILFEKKMGIYRIIYLGMYILLITYPLYQILVHASELDALFSLVINAGLILVLLGIVYGMPELIVVYYIIAGLVYKVNGIPDAPGLHEIILYSIFILHADIISKILTIGVGSRKIRIGLIGIPLTIAIPVLIAGGYIALSYYILELFMGLVDRVVYSSELAYIVFTSFLMTRIGSLMLFVFIVFSVFFVLTNYVTDLISDTIWLSPSYAMQKIKTWVQSEYRELLRNRTWHQKLYTGAVTTFMLIAITSILYPLLYDAFGALVAMGFGEQLKYLAFFMSLPISYAIGSSLKSWAYGFMTPEAHVKRARLEAARALRVHKSDPVFFLLITVGYLFLLMIIDPGLAYHAIYTVLGSEPPEPTSTIGVFNTFITWLNNAVYYINYYTIPYLNNYISRATNEYRGLIGIIKMAIKILWG